MSLHRFSEYCYQVEHEGVIYRVLFDGAVVVREDGILRDWLKAINPLVAECSYIRHGYALYTDATGTDIFAGDSSSSWDYLPINLGHLCGSLRDLFLSFPDTTESREGLKLEALEITERYAQLNAKRYPWLNLKAEDIRKPTAAKAPAESEVTIDKETLVECTQYARMMCELMPPSIRATLPDNDILAALEYACDALDMG